MMWMSLRIAAPTMAIFGLPAAVRRSLSSMSIGLCLSPTSAGMKNALRRAFLPIFDIIPRSRSEVPDWRTDLGRDAHEGRQGLSIAELADVGELREDDVDRRLTHTGDRFE